MQLNAESAVSDASPNQVEKKRRRGRAERVSAPERVQSNTTNQNRQLRSIPTYELQDEESLVLIEEQADWIAKEIGFEFRGDGDALALFNEAGATVDGERVRFDSGHLKQLCSTAPASYEMHGRDGTKNFTLGGEHVVLMPGYGSPFATDLDRGRRYASLEDFENFVKLTYMSPWLHHSGGTICEPVDVPVNKRHLDMVYAHLRYSTKPFMGGVTSPDRARDSLELAKIVFGEAYLENNVVIQANININSPLVFDDTMSGALRVYAAANQSVAISPAIFGGAMGPVTQPAVIAQTHAEAMAGIALTQLVRKGCPVVYGSFHTTMNLKSGALTFGSPEANLTTMVLAQLGRRLKVPVRCGGGQITSANSADGQAMQDSTSSMMISLLSGANQIWHAAGWLEGGLTMGYEKFVMDMDHCGMLMRMVRGLEVNEESFGRDAYLESGPGQNFLSTQHTLRHYADANYQSEIPEAGPYETWLENGSLSAEQRANGRWKAMLEAYEAPAIDPAIDEALKETIERKKSSMPDEWY